MVVDYLVDGGNDQIQPGDWLILVTALYLRPSELCSKEFYQGEVERNRAN